MPNGNNEMSYQERAFREKAAIAGEQFVETAKERGLLARKVKALSRADFKQQRQKIRKKVMHVASIRQYQGPKTYGLQYGHSRVTGGGGAGKATMGTRGTRSATFKRMARYGRETRKPIGMSAGGRAELAKGRRWTTSGWKEIKSEDLSKYQTKLKLIDRFTPLKSMQKGKGAFGPQGITPYAKGGAKGGRVGAVAGARVAGTTSTKGQRQMQETQKKRLEQRAKLDAYKKKIAPKYGPEAAEMVLAEYQRRLQAMMEGGGLFGKIKSLFGGGGRE